VNDSAENASALLVIPDSNLANPDLAVFPTALVEPGGSFSDVFGVAETSPGCDGERCLAFTSDTETPQAVFGPFPGVTIVPENGGVHDATRYLHPDLVEQGFTAQFTSDTEVPEPSTLALLASGLIGMLPIVRRKIRL